MRLTGCGHPERAESVHRAGQSELGGAETLHEVTTPAAARFVGLPEHRIDRREPAGNGLGCDLAASQYPVPVQQHLGAENSPSGVISRAAR